MHSKRPWLLIPFGVRQKIVFTLFIAACAFGIPAAPAISYTDVHSSDEVWSYKWCDDETIVYKKYYLMESDESDDEPQPEMVMYKYSCVNDSESILFSTYEKTCFFESFDYSVSKNILVGKLDSTTVGIIENGILRKMSTCAFKELYYEKQTGKFNLISNSPTCQHQKSDLLNCVFVPKGAQDIIHNYHEKYGLLALLNTGKLQFIVNGPDTTSLQHERARAANKVLFEYNYSRKLPSVSIFNDVMYFIAPSNRCVIRMPLTKKPVVDSLCITNSIDAIQKLDATLFCLQERETVRPSITFWSNGSRLPDLKLAGSEPGCSASGKYLAFMDSKGGRVLRIITLQHKGD